MITCSRHGRARHPTSSPITGEPAGARSVSRPPKGPGRASADLPAAAAAEPLIDARLISLGRRHFGPGTTEWSPVGIAGHPQPGGKSGRRPSARQSRGERSGEQGAGKPNSKHLRPVPRLVAQGRFTPPWVRKMWPGCGGLYMPTRWPPRQTPRSTRSSRSNPLPAAPAAWAAYGVPCRAAGERIVPDVSCRLAPRRHRRCAIERSAAHASGAPQPDHRPPPSQTNPGPLPAGN